jgi:hypothetical protein
VSRTIGSIYSLGRLRTTVAGAAWTVRKWTTKGLALMHGECQRVSPPGCNYLHWISLFAVARLLTRKVPLPRIRIAEASLRDGCLIELLLTTARLPTSCNEILIRQFERAGHTELNTGIQSKC